MYQIGCGKGTDIVKRAYEGETQGDGDIWHRAMTEKTWRDMGCHHDHMNIIRLEKMYGSSTAIDSL